MVGNLELTGADFLGFKSFLWHRGISWETFKDLEEESKLGFVEGWWMKKGSKAYSKNNIVDHEHLLDRLLDLEKNSEESSPR